MNQELNPQWGQFGCDPWGLRQRGDRDFRLALGGVLLACGLLVHFASEWPGLVPRVGEKPPVAPLTLSLTLPIPEAKPKPKPKTPPAPTVAVAQPAPEVPPKPLASKPVIAPVKDPHGARPAAPQAKIPTKAQARSQAEQAGLMAMRAQLQALRETPVSTSVPGSKGAPRVAAIAGNEMGGLDPKPRFRGAGDASEAALVKGDVGHLAAHKSGEVAAGPGATSVAVAQADRQAVAGRQGRSLEEIQLAFEQQKLGFYSLFNRAARSAGGRRSGSVVVSLTISPAGKVTDCRIVSSSFRDPELHEKLLRKVRTLSFERKQVPEFTYSGYPITFIPS